MNSPTLSLTLFQNYLYSQEITKQVSTCFEDGTFRRRSFYFLVNIL